MRSSILTALTESAAKTNLSELIVRSTDDGDTWEAYIRERGLMRAYDPVAPYGSPDRVELRAEGRTSSEAISALELLLQKWW